MEAGNGALAKASGGAGASLALAMALWALAGWVPPLDAFLGKPLLRKPSVPPVTWAAHSFCGDRSKLGSCSVDSG